MKIKINRNHAVQVFFLLASIIMGFFFIIPLRDAADRRAELLKNRLLGQIEDSLGLSIQYQSISPALLSIVTVKGLKISFDQGDFSADRVRVYYNPLRYFSRDKNDPIRQITKVVVSNGLLNLSLSTEGVSTPPKGKEFDPWVLLADKSVVLTDIFVNIRVDDILAFNAQDVFLNLKDDNGTVRYTFKGFLHADDIGDLEKIGKIKSEITSIGSFSTAESTANGRLDILSAESDFIVLEPLSIDFTYTENKLTGRRIDDSKPLDLSFSYSDDGWGVNVETVGLSLRELVSPGPSIRAMDPWFSSVLDGHFVLSANAISGDFQYDADMELFIPSGKLPWNIKAVLNLQGSKYESQIDLVSFSSDWGNLTYSGRFKNLELAPDGVLSLNLKDILLGYPVSAVFSLETSNGTISAEPILFDAADLKFQDFRFLIIREPELSVISLLIVPEMPDGEKSRRLTIDGLFDTTDKPVFHGFTSIEGFESAYIARLMGFSAADKLPVLKDTSLNMNGYFEANSENWVLSVNNADLVDNKNPDNLLSFSGRGSPGNWSLDSFRLSWNDYIVDGRGFGRSTENGGYADARLLIGEQIYPINAKWFSDGKLEINGDFGLKAVVGPRSANGRSIQILSSDISIPLKDGRLISTIDVRGRYSRDFWELYINNAGIKLADRSEQSDITLNFKGTVNPDRIVIPELNIEDTIGSLSGNAVFESAESGAHMKGRFFMSSKDGENYEIALLRDGDFWDIGLDIKDAQLKRIMNKRLAGTLNVAGRMTGSFEDPLITLDVNTVDALLDNNSLEGRGSVSMESGRLRIQDLYYEYEGMSLSRGLFLMNLNSGTLRSTAELNATYNQVPVSSGLSLAVDFGRSFKLQELQEISETGFNGTLATRPILWNDIQHLPAFTFQFVKDQNGFTVQTPDREILSAEYEFISGKLDISSNSPLPVVVKGGGTIKDGQLDLSFPELNIDPVLINYAMLRDPILLQYHVIFQSGRFIGNLDINGPISNPAINGVILADNLKIDTPYTYADIKPASTKLHFDNHRITIDRIEIPIGDGILYGGGHIVLDRLKLAEFDMVYGGKARGKGLGVPVYYPLMGVNLDGQFTGEVHMTGGDKYFYLEGDIRLPYLKASLGSAIIPIRQVPEGKYPTSVDLDFNFTTGNNCNFYLPNEQFKIVKATAEANQIINLVYSNHPKSMNITGDLSIKSGDIYYFDRDFQITTGALRFNESLGDFNPILALRAETKVRDNAGEDVTVALVYNAPVKSDFNPNIESVPARSDSEIMALFGQAMVPYSESQDYNATSTILMASGGMFGQVGIVQPFEEVLREGLNLDMVTIRTDIIENTLAEGFSRSENTKTAVQSSSFGKYLDNTSLYAGKYIGDALFISGTVSANYFEGQRLRSVFGGLEFETAFSLEMETPFFNVAWSYSPDPTRKQNFVADNEISLKWHFVY